MQINQQNIADFISELYKERKGEIAPNELLQKWSTLSDFEINQQLEGLFQSWGMSNTEKNIAIDRFVKRQQAIQQSNTYASLELNYDYPPPPERKKSYMWVVYVLLVTILGMGAYVGYKYLQFISFEKIYAITDNISIRDHEGKVVGRMDLYDRNGSVSNSFSKLRSVDDQVYYRGYEGSTKEYPTRKVLMDSTTFIEYLTNLDEVSHYVNINFVVNDKKEFDFYQTAFQAIQSTPNDNAELKALYRKIIVGSMAISSEMEGKYIVNYAKDLPTSTIKNTSAFVIQSIQNQQHYVIIAGVNDGMYYRFEGDIKNNQFAPPVVIKAINDTDQESLKGAYRFIKSEGKTKLYDVTNRITSDYELIEDVLGKNVAFKYNKPPPPPDPEPYDTMRIQL